VRQPGSGAVVYAVGRDVNAIGYAGLSFITDAVAVVPLAADMKQSFVAPTPENILSRRYPWTHFVYLFLNQQPGRSLDALRLELLRFVYSRQGQQLMAARRYVPIPAPVATEDLRQLGIRLSHQHP
jgi:phosphate transport system substrate-binding protein